MTASGRISFWTAVCFTFWRCWR